MKGQLSKTRNRSVFWTLIFCLSLSYIAVFVQALDHQVGREVQRMLFFAALLLSTQIISF